LEEISMTPRSIAGESVTLAHANGENPGDSSSCSRRQLLNEEDTQVRHSDVDLATGRIRPISVEALRTRQEELTRRLAEIDAEDSTSDVKYDEFMRNVDEKRRRQGRPTAFEGCY
jgi:hypothetical protein